jgi:hypothetical protein
MLHTPGYRNDVAAAEMLDDICQAAGSRDSAAGCYVLGWHSEAASVVFLPSPPPHT